MRLQGHKQALSLALPALLFFGCTASAPVEGEGEGGAGGKTDVPGGKPGAPDASTAPECELEVTGEIDAPDVDDLDRLFELATTLDWPAMTVEKLATGCSSLELSDESRDALGALVAREAFEDLATDFPEALVVSDLTEGGTRFVSRIEWGRQVVHERIEDGLWDPSADPEGSELFGRLDQLVSAVTDPVTSAPADYVQIGVEFENAECTQDAVGLFDQTDGSLTLVHRLPRC